MALVDISRLNSLRQQSFIGGDFVAAVASDFSQILLFNPAASGVILLVYGFLEFESGANQGSVWTSQTTLANNKGTQPNKYFNGALSKAIVYSEATATQDHGGVKKLMNVNPGASQMVPLPFRAPFVVPAGWGCLVACDVANISLGVTFDWDEVPG